MGSTGRGSSLSVKRLSRERFAAGGGRPFCRRIKTEKAEILREKDVVCRQPSCKSRLPLCQFPGAETRSAAPGTCSRSDVSGRPSCELGPGPRVTGQDRLRVRVLGLASCAYPGDPRQREILFLHLTYPFGIVGGKSHPRLSLSVLWGPGIHSPHPVDGSCGQRATRFFRL